MTSPATTDHRGRRSPPLAGDEASIGDSCSRDASAAEGFRRLYALVADELADVEQRFRLSLDSEHELLRPLLRHGTQLGGKRLRPALLLLAAKLFGPVREEHRVLGVVIEMVHTATLVHDDVLDNAHVRRHAPTINHRWNNHASILLGDYLFSQSFRLAASLDSPLACQRIGDAARRVCEGELRQVLLRDAIDLDEATYIELLDAKTAELCRVACALGAEYADANGDQIAALNDFGRSLGIAFQLADDYLDLWGDDGRVGKTLGTDLLQGKLTLPLIRLLDRSDTAQRHRLDEILQGPPRRRLERLRPLLEASDAAAYTRALARQYQQQAVAALQSLPSGDARAALSGLAELAVSRDL